MRRNVLYAVAAPCALILLFLVWCVVGGWLSSPSDSPPGLGHPDRAVDLGAPHRVKVVFVERDGAAISPKTANVAVDGISRWSYDPDGAAILLDLGQSPRHGLAFVSPCYARCAVDMECNWRRVRLRLSVASGSTDQKEAEESAYVKARRRTWARLLARVYGVDALKCGLARSAPRVRAAVD